MKKTYMKPEVYFENFELSANIATGCGWSIEHAQGHCWKGIESFQDLNIFLDAPTCKSTPDENGLCYHNSSDATRIFTS